MHYVYKKTVAWDVQVWDLKDIGLQATQRIMQAADPLALFTELSQNFPALVSSLSRQEVRLGQRPDAARSSCGAHFLSFYAAWASCLIFSMLACTPGVGTGAWCDDSSHSDVACARPGVLSLMIGGAVGA